MELNDLEARKAKLTLERDISRMEREKTAWAAWKYGKWVAIPFVCFVLVIMVGNMIGQR